jgi:hypothetical protein
MGVDNDVPNWFQTLENFYWSPSWKWPPQYRKNSTLSDINDISYVGRLWCPQLIHDIEKFLPVAICLPIRPLTTGLKKLIKSYLWNRTMLNFCGIVAAILKMETGRNFSRSGIISGRWNRTMLNLCGIVVAILKMATGRNFSISWINWGHHNLPTYEMSLISDNVEFLRYCGGHFQR